MLNRAKISITREVIQGALKLPDEAIITNMQYNPSANTLDIFVEHRSFPSCPPGSYCYTTSIDIGADKLLLRADRSQIFCARCQTEMDEELRQEIDG